MRKLIYQCLISLDGYFEGPNKEIDWHIVDESFNRYAINFLNNIDYLVFGRVTYQLMESYWPTSQAITDSPIVAERMNNLSKLVVSKSLPIANWNNTTIIRDNVDTEIRKLKNERGKAIAVFGSSNFATTLIHYDLIDEYRIIISPTILGAGHTLFNGIGQRINFKLIKSETFISGNILLYYSRK